MHTRSDTQVGPPPQTYWIKNGRGQTIMGEGLVARAQTLPLAKLGRVRGQGPEPATIYH